MVVDRTDRQVVKTQNWPNLGTVSFVGRWRVLQVPQVLGCCTVVCCVLCAVCCVLLCAAAAGCAAGGVGGKVKVGGWSASLLPAFTAINLIIVIIVVTALLKFTFQRSKTEQIFELRVRGIAKLPP